MKKAILYLFILTIISFSSNAQTKTLVDKRDGHVYKTIVIGNQKWMSENLAYNAGGGSWVYDNSNINVKKYGYLYNFNTASNACPAGWHLPSKQEWNTLLSNYSDRSKAGFALHPGGGSGFNVSYGGFTSVVRGSNAPTYSYKDAWGKYWTSVNKDYDSWAISFGDIPSFSWQHIGRGLSVRCVCNTLE